MTVEPISDERLAEIRAGLEECTGGEWTAGCLARHEDGCQCAYIFGGDYMGGIGTVYIDNGIRGLAEGQNDCPPKDEARANLLHIARCSPATILSLLSRLDKAEAGWQPIETVPWWDDVLFYDPEYRNDHRKVFEGYCDLDRGLLLSAKGEPVSPTHWRPLPPPPPES